MNEQEYRDYPYEHIHPIDPTVVEFVAYARLDGAWDVYVFEPPGSCPELEARRVDEDHIFIRRIASVGDLEDVVCETENFLGDGYVRVPFYHETGTRKIIGRIVDHLRHHGANNMWVRSVSEGEWELLIRQKDVAFAQAFVASNVGTAD